MKFLLLIVAFAIIPTFASATIYFSDDAEHGICSKPWAGQNTCKDPVLRSVGGLLKITRQMVRGGNYAYECVVDNPKVDNQVCKLNSTNDAVKDAIDIRKSKREAYYGVWFYVARGFDDDAWHVNMQWKLTRPSYSGQSPKMAIGFRGGKVQVILRQPPIIDSRLYEPSISHPRNRWFHVEVYLRTDKYNGQIKVWQNGQLIHDLAGINTISQQLREGGESSNTSLFMGVANYFGESNASPSILYWDDVVVSSERIYPRTDGPPSAPTGVRITAR